MVSCHFNWQLSVTMATIEDFVQAPSESGLAEFTKEQLLEIARHYGIKISSSSARLKDSLVAALFDGLVDKGVIPKKDEDWSGASVSEMTFEQRKQMLLLQMEHEKFQAEQRLECEKLQVEQERLKLEARQLELVQPPVDNQAPRFDIRTGLRLVPAFNEKDPETFFALFERAADAEQWSDSNRVLLLQCVLTGKAQEAFCSLAAVPNLQYSTVKDAVLKSFELVPEAYRRRFRTWRKGDRQSHLEFARDLTCQFNRWRTSLKVTTFEALCDLIVLEQFKDSVPERVATYVDDHIDVKTAMEAAALADKFVLTRRGSYESRAKDEGSRHGYDRRVRSPRRSRPRAQSAGSFTCHTRKCLP